MSDDNLRNLPGTITLDLDAAQRPEEEIKPPFVVKVQGRSITMEDPAELDWRDLAVMDNPIEFLRLSLSTEDRKFLLSLNLPGWKFNQFMEAYYAHFDLDDKVREAQRRQRLSGV